MSLLDYKAKDFLSSCQKGNIEDIKKYLSQGVDINHQDKEEFSGVHHACMNNQLEVVHFLQQNNANLNLINNQGQTALHLACDRQSKEIVLFLLTHGVDPEVKNNQNLKAGEGNIESKMFVNNIAAEHKAFDVLTKQQIQKLTQIFEEIDYDNTKVTDFKRSYLFNKWVDESVTDSMADKDTRDFINSVGICNKTVVNIDEWLFAFSKLLVVDQAMFDKFITDYEAAYAQRGRFRDWVSENFS